MPMENTRVFLSVCSHRQPWWPHVVSTQNMAAHAAREGILCQSAPHIGESLISRARNDALADFMASDFTHLMFVDDDIEYPIDTITRLVAADRGIVTGLCRLKIPEVHLALRLFHGPQAAKMYEKLLTNPRVVEIAYGSTGCMLIKREVIVRLQEHYQDLKYMKSGLEREQWALFMPFIHGGEYLSEDWAFCRRARNLGYKIWADSGVLCCHWGHYAYTLRPEHILGSPPPAARPTHSAPQD
jgi:hypothetical protein